MLDSLAKAIERIDVLPTLPTVVTKAMQIMENPRSSVSDLSKVIAVDQSLTMQVLKLVNSAYFGFPKKISSVDQALVIVGFATIRSMMMNVSVRGVFKGESDALDRSQLWLHSIGTAVAAKLIAKKQRRVEPEEAFVAGLIHDVGKILIDQFAHQEFKEIVRLVDNEGLSMIEAEQQVIQATHSLVGKRLAEKWRLPESMTAAMLYHHRPADAVKSQELVAAVHLGDILCRKAQIGSGGGSYVPEPEKAALDVLQLKAETLEILLTELQQIDMSSLME